MKKMELVLKVLGTMVVVMYLALFMYGFAGIAGEEQVDAVVISCEAQDPETVRPYSTGVGTYALSHGNTLGYALANSVDYEDVDYEVIVEVNGEEYQLTLDYEVKVGETIKVSSDKLK
jgi:hypothetical protein